MDEATKKPANGGQGKRGGAHRRRDWAELEALLERHAIAVERLDLDLFRSCFTDRVTVRFAPPINGAPDEPVTPEEWAAFAAADLGWPPAGRHRFVLFSLLVDEDRAEATVHYRAEACPRASSLPLLDDIVYFYGFRRTTRGWQIDQISAQIITPAVESVPAPRGSHDEPAAPSSEVRLRLGSSPSDRRRGGVRT